MKSETNTQQIKKLLLGLAEYFATSLSPGQLAMYAEDLEDIPVETLAPVIKLIRQSETFFPKPAQIREFVFGNAKDDAIEIASKIIEAMGKFGWTNPEKARAFMGEIAWEVVKREGGWGPLCERTKNSDLQILKAQWRELARVVSTQQRRETVTHPMLETTKPKELENKK